MNSPDQIGRPVTTNTGIQDAADFIKSNGVTGLDITPDALKTFYETYQLSVSDIAGLLDCHEELILRKLRRVPGISPYPLLPEQADYRPLRKGHEQAYYRPLRKGHHEAFEVGRAYIEEHNLESKNLTEEHLEFLYHELRLPLEAIGELIGRSEARVRQLMRYFKIRSRSVGEARTGRYNVNFFKQWSPGMAWLLGLLFTDGCAHRNQITLASTDIDLLQKAQALLGSDSATTPNNYKGRPVYVISLGHKELRNDLAELGLTRRKSLTMEFPEVPQEYIRHFIRGCWDGDGGFTQSKGRLIATYTSGAESFINRIAMELFKVGIWRTVLHRRNSADDFHRMRVAYGNGPYPLTVRKRNQGRAFDLIFGTALRLMRLREFLYESVDKTIYLSRKHDLLMRHVGPCGAIGGFD
jgi:hypothetical protein